MIRFLERKKKSRNQETEVYLSCFWRMISNAFTWSKRAKEGISLARRVEWRKEKTKI